MRSPLQIREEVRVGSGASTVFPTARATGETRSTRHKGDSAVQSEFPVTLAQRQGTNGTRTTEYMNVGIERVIRATVNGFHSTKTECFAVEKGRLSLEDGSFSEETGYFLASNVKFSVERM